VKNLQRSKGAVEFARLGLDGTEVARALDVSEPVVSLWKSGQRKPGIANRKAIFDRYGKPPIEAWDEAPGDESAATTLPRWGDGTIRAIAETIKAAVKEQVEKVIGDAKATPEERIGIALDAAEALQKLQKLTGENVDEITLLKHPKFQRAMAEIIAASKPFPEASRAIGRALQRLDEAG
jgi:transcriptional regulator with XRE-family HTH domain